MIKVNLLSPEKKELAAGGEVSGLTEEERTPQWNIPVVVAALAITLGIIGSLYFIQSGRIASRERTLAERKARKVELDNVLKTLDQLEKTKQDLERKVRIISDLKNNQDTAVIMMDQLSRALPDWVWLTRLNFNGNAVDLDGNALSNNLIADLINNLQSTNHFYNIELKTSVKAKQAGLDLFKFKIVCRFRKEIPKKAG
ncbi:MAG: PilN domain-containing protein [Acidobacteriota bacterium]|jgi:Tfp pilus assembly protein PilN|nr:PilN domain-containing protein [Acidobacteriota bacterium]